MIFLGVDNVIVKLRKNTVILVFQTSNFDNGC